MSGVGVGMKSEPADCVSLAIQQESQHSPDSQDFFTVYVENSGVPGQHDVVVATTSAESTSSVSTLPTGSKAQTAPLLFVSSSVPQSVCNAAAVPTSFILQPATTQQVGDVKVYDNRKWNHGTVLFLLNTVWERRDRFHDPRVTKKQLFIEVGIEMKKEGYLFSELEVERKWHSLLTTYKRCKERHTRSGEESSWPYYQIIEDIKRKKTRKKSQFTKDSSETLQNLIPEHPTSPTCLSATSPSYSPIPSPSPPPSPSSPLSSEAYAPPPKRKKVPISRTDDNEWQSKYITMVQDWQHKRTQQEDRKVNLVETILQDRQQRLSRDDKDKELQLELERSRNKQLKLIHLELNQLREDNRREFSMFRQSINSLTSVMQRFIDNRSFNEDRGRRLFQ